MKLAFTPIGQHTWGEGDKLCIAEDFVDGSEPIMAQWGTRRVIVGNFEETGMVTVDDDDNRQWDKLIEFPSATAAKAWAEEQDWTDELLATFEIQP